MVVSDFCCNFALRNQGIVPRYRLIRFYIIYNVIFNVGQIINGVNTIVSTETEKGFVSKNTAAKYISEEATKVWKEDKGNDVLFTNIEKKINDIAVMLENDNDMPFGWLCEPSEVSEIEACENYYVRYYPNIQDKENGDVYYIEWLIEWANDISFTSIF